MESDDSDKLPGGGRRKPTKRGQKKRDCQTEMNKTLRKKTKHAITMHYYQRLLSLHPVYLECKKIFEEGTKFNDVFVKRATHQDGKGRIDRDKILAEEDSDSSQLLVEKSHIHAAHIVGLGLNPNAWNHLRYERIYGGTFQC